MQTQKKIIDHIQNELKVRMEAKNIGPTNLEKKAGLRQSVVRNILNGSSKNPGIESITAIAKILDCSLDDLVGNEKPQNTTKTKTIDSWNPDLYQDCTKQIQNCLQNKNLKLNGEQILMLIKEAYLYFSKLNVNQAEPKFIEWLIDTFV